MDEVLAGKRSLLYASVADMAAVEAAQRKQEAAEEAQAEAAAQELLEVSGTLAAYKGISNAFSRTSAT